MNARKDDLPAQPVDAALEISLRQLGLWGKDLPSALVESRRAQLAEILEAAAPHLLAASAAKLRGWYDERMSEESAPDVTLTDYEHGREVGTTEGILAAALLIEAATK